jgi:hypothetical protein
VSPTVLPEYGAYPVDVTVAGTARNLRNNYVFSDSNMAFNPSELRGQNRFNLPFAATDYPETGFKGFPYVSSQSGLLAGMYGLVRETYYRKHGTNLSVTKTMQFIYRTCMKNLGPATENVVLERKYNGVSGVVHAVPQGTQLLSENITTPGYLQHNNAVDCFRPDGSVEGQREFKDAYYSFSLAVYGEEGAFYVDCIVDPSWQWGSAGVPRFGQGVVSTKDAVAAAAV